MAASAITAVVGGTRRLNVIVTSTLAPTVDNDGTVAGGGRLVGDMWIKTTVTVTVYICTSNATGAAVWTQLS